MRLKKAKKNATSAAVVRRKLTAPRSPRKQASPFDESDPDSESSCSGACKQSSHTVFACVPYLCNVKKKLISYFSDKMLVVPGVETCFKGRSAERPMDAEYPFYSAFEKATCPQ